MFLKNPSLLFKSSGFRLIIMYTVLFVLSSLVINIYVYTAISSIIYEQSRKEIEGNLNDLAQIYQEEGLEAFRKEVFDDPNDEYLVRLTGSAGNTVIVRTPDDWPGQENEKLEKSMDSGNVEWRVRDGDGISEVATLKLTDGSTLQMGQQIAEREELLAGIRRAYLLTVLPIILVAYLGGLFIADRALNPVGQLKNTLNSIVSNAKIEMRVPVHRTDKLHEELIQPFNSMLDRIEVLINGMRNVLDNVAHDLRTPMTRLRGAAEIALQSGGDLDALREALGDCVEESGRILVMLNTLMDVSEAETGTMKLNLEETNVAPLICDVVDLYAYVAEDKGITVNTGFPNELYLTADRGRLRQVIANLLDNAIKYTPSGGRIDIEAVRGENEVEIFVRDTGIGISEEELDNIWNRLYRGDKSRSERGLGLGLSLVRAIVSAHGGRVEVLSNPGTGSIFSVHLPV